jgi:hypothetical protein
MFCVSPPSEIQAIFTFHFLVHKIRGHSDIIHLKGLGKIFLLNVK